MKAVRCCTKAVSEDCCTAVRKLSVKAVVLLSRQNTVYRLSKQRACRSNEKLKERDVLRDCNNDWSH